MKDHYAMSSTVLAEQTFSIHAGAESEQLRSEIESGDWLLLEEAARILGPIRQHPDREERFDRPPHVISVAYWIRHGRVVNGRTVRLDGMLRRENPDDEEGVMVWMTSRAALKRFKMACQGTL